MMQSDLRPQIIDCILNDQKLEAIKLLREGSGLGLAEAEQVIRAVEELLLDEGLDSSAAAAMLDAALRGPEALEAGAEITQLIRAGRKLEAIKRFRELHGVGLKEAKHAVEMIARADPAAGASRRTGCTGIIMLALSVGAVIMFAGTRFILPMF